MSEIAEILRKSLNELSESIKKDIQNHTGQTAASLQINVIENTNNTQGILKSENRIKIIEYLDRGTRPWSNPEKYKSLGFILAQSGWASARGVNPYAAAHSIAYTGSQIFKGQKKGLQLDQKIDNFEKDLKDKLKIPIKNIILHRITEIYKK